jgi:hypothetical protein
MEVSKDKFLDLIGKLAKQVPAFAKKVQPLFEKNGWEWGIGRTLQVPNFAEIETTLYGLISDVQREFHRDGLPFHITATGRLQVRTSMWEGRLTGTLELVPESDLTTVTL